MMSYRLGRFEGCTDGKAGLPWRLLASYAFRDYALGGLDSQAYSEGYKAGYDACKAKVVA